MISYAYSNYPGYHRNCPGLFWKAIALAAGRGSWFFIWV